MSRADDRRQEQAAHLAACAHDRPVEQPEEFDSDPLSWHSHCVGNRTGHHMLPINGPAGYVRCRACWHVLKAPEPAA
jgi:hypothetical protein